MRNDDAAAEQIVRDGWRQGSVLPPALVQRLLDDLQIPDIPVPRSNVPTGLLKRLRLAWAYVSGRQQKGREFCATSEMWVVVTQDCDLVQSSFEKEPFVELVRVLAIPSETKDGRLHWGDNPRTFQFYNPPEGDNQQLLETRITDRARIDRRYLAGSSPDLARGLHSENVKRLCRWISGRYVRASFPDAFNERVKRSLDKMGDKKGQLFKKGDVLSGIYILVEDEELSNSEEYHVVIWATMKPDDFIQRDKLELGQQLVDHIEAALGSCEGIEIEQAQLKSEGDVSLDHLRKFKRWDFDSLTLRQEPLHSLGPNL